MSLAVVTSDRFADHVTPPGHPERVERAEVMQVATTKWQKGGGTVLAPREATDEDLRRIHDAEHIAGIRKLRGRPSMLDPDTFTSPQSDEVARLAAGAVLTAIDHVVSGGKRTRALAMVRPPGHHAERDRAMGFCLYNNIAVGAAYARATKGIDRVAIVDYDVHHGNGTQHSFYSDPTVLFISSHQYPFYPGTGALNETGAGAGEGFTLNIPLSAGSTDQIYDDAYRIKAIPKLRQFKPQLLLISAGFDLHQRDPLAGMEVSTEGIGKLTSQLLASADELCDGRVVFVTEGGYDTKALYECLEKVMALASA
jgi:acetoin utilization deacetylase AcuC-like enzyme